MLKLDARLHSDLKWNIEINPCLPPCPPPCWFLDFGFHERLSSSYPSAVLASDLIAIEQFIEQCVKPHRLKNQRVYLYRGPLEEACHLNWDAAFEEDYLEWKESMPPLRDLRTHYAIEVFADYLHRLAAPLPEEVYPFISFDLSFFSSPTRIAQLLSPHHFSHIELETQGTPYPIRSNPEGVKLGVVFPLLTNSSEELFKQIDATVMALQDEKIPYQLISESHLRQGWDGLDTLMLFSQGISAQGLRKAQGFAAAEGRVVIVGETRGLGEAITLKECLKKIRGRGI